MSDKENEKPTSENDVEQAPKAATLSIAPAMDLSFDAVTVPPPPKSGAGSGGGSLSIPRAPALPKESRPAAAPAKRKRNEDDIFSIFDVESNTAADDIPVSVQTPAPVPAKPKSQLGTRAEEREQTRSKQFKIDEDLFNMSAGLFSNSPGQSPLVAPDMSALTATGLSDKPPAKPASTSALEDLALPVAPIAPLAPLDPAALTAAPGQTSTETKKSNGKTGLIVGVVAAVALAAGAFFFFTQKSTAPDSGATAQNTTASPEANNLDTRPTREPAEAPRVANADAPKDEPASLTKTNPTADTGSAPKDSADKPATKSADPGKATAGAEKPSGAEATAKPAEEEKPATPAKTQSLAEAMAAGLSAPPPPPPSGPEFNKSAAQSALSGAAGAAAGCKAPGDPSGTARVSVTFAPSGRATRAVVNGPPFAGTATGQCIAGAFRGVSVPAFSGDPVTVSKSVTIR